MPLLVCFLLAAAAADTHRARAEHAEALGRMQQAAREYEAAWEEEQAPELLYRLGIARRKLKEYAKAREAFRAYLRVAPEGGLRQEVERQLAKVQVLIEASAEDYADSARPRTAEQHLVRPDDVPVASEQRSAIDVNGVRFAPAPPMEIHFAQPAPRPREAFERVTLGPRPAPRSKAPVWLATGAAAGAVAAGLLWWDGARVSNDLDARFVSGDLTARDATAYSRARAESIGGRVLMVAAVALAAGAIALW